MWLKALANRHFRSNRSASMTFWRFLALIGLMAGLVPPATAQEPALSAADRSAIRQAIEAQVEAFRRDEPRRPSKPCSAPPAIFMGMVRQGYRPVYRPRSFDFREIVTLNDAPTQKVDVVGPDGCPFTAFYPMVRLPDGSWRIDGWYLRAPDDPRV
jgi:Domain of unknown function (DUF4864)